jgi:ATP-dependent helicase/nuclease subunit A
VVASPTDAGVPDRPDDRSARLGQAVHRVLQWAASADAGAADRSRGELARAAAAEFDVTDPLAVEAIASRILSSPDCARFFDARSLAWAGNEVPVAGADADAGRVMRIDRLVCIGGSPPTWWVLDYKLDATPEHNPAHRDQLAAYRRAVQALQPGERVRMAFITAAGELIEPA